MTRLNREGGALEKVGRGVAEMDHTAHVRTPTHSHCASYIARDGLGYTFFMTPSSIADLSNSLLWTQSSFFLDKNVGVIEHFACITFLKPIRHQ